MNDTAQRAPLAFLAFVLLVVALLFYSEMWSLPPRNVHSWAQADRLSLAYHFFDEANPFHARTHDMRATDRRVGVELPVQAWVAGRLAALFGQKSWIAPLFRLFTLLGLLLGLWAMGRLALRRTGQWSHAAFMAAFVWAAPVVAYYGCNFLPDAFGLGLALLGLERLEAFAGQQRPRAAYAALALWIAAAFVKSTLGLYLLPLGVYLLYAFGKKYAPTSGPMLGFLSLASIGAALLVSHYYYMLHVDEVYGDQVFLSHAMPLQGTWADWQRYTGIVWDRHLDDYLNEVQQSAWLLLALFALIGLRRPSRTHAYAGIALLGALANYYLMGAQFEVHDYYAITAFMPALALVGLAGIEAAWALLKRQQGGAWGMDLVLLLLTGWMLVEGYNGLSARNGLPIPPDEAWLYERPVPRDSLDLPAEAPVMVLGGIAPNLGLVLLDRHGLTRPAYALSEKPEEVLMAMEAAQLRYALAGAAWYAEFLEKWPCLAPAFRLRQRWQQVCVLERVDGSALRFWEKRPDGHFVPKAGEGPCPVPQADSLAPFSQLLHGEAIYSQTFRQGVPGGTRWGSLLELEAKDSVALRHVAALRWHGHQFHYADTVFHVAAGRQRLAHTWALPPGAGLAEWHWALVAGDSVRLRHLEFWPLAAEN